MKLENTLRRIQHNYYLTAAISLVLVNIALYFKCSSIYRNPQLYAEDGNIFFTQAFYGDFSTVFQKYAGYYVFYQRFFGYLGSLSPVSLVPEIYFTGRTLAILLLVLPIASERSPFRYKILAAVFTALIPINDEVIHGLVNAQWFLGLGLLVLIVSSPPKTTFGWVLDYLYLILTGLTGPFILVFFPLVVVKVYLERSRYSLLFLTLTMILCAVQSTDLDLSRTPGLTGGAKIEEMPRYVIHFFAYLFYGEFKSQLDINNVLALFQLPGLILAAAFYFGVTVYAIRKRHFALFAFSITGPIVLALALYVYKSSPHTLIVGAYRYRYLPTVCLFWTCLILFELSRNTITRMACLMPVFLMLLNLFIFWDQYKAEKIPNMKWEQRSRCIGRKYPCRVPIYPKGWMVGLDQPPG